MRNVIITIVLLMIFLSIVDSLISGSKLKRYIKGIILITSLIIVFDYLVSFKNINMNINNKQIDIDSKNSWITSAETISELLEDEIKRYLENYDFEYDDINVKISTDYSTFNIESVNISSKNFSDIKNILSQHFNINDAYILNDGEPYG